MITNQKTLDKPGDVPAYTQFEPPTANTHKTGKTVHEFARTWHRVRISDLSIKACRVVIEYADRLKIDEPAGARLYTLKRTANYAYFETQQEAIDFVEDQLRQNYYRAREKYLKLTMRLDLAA